MATDGFGVEAWVKLFREIGLDDARMHQWHAAFEKHWPGAHQSFLQWLRLPVSEIDRIRESSRGEWAGR